MLILLKILIALRVERYRRSGKVGPLPAILRDLILLVPSLWLAVRPRVGKNVV